MATYEIPLSATPQRFTIALNGVDYNLTVRWNVPAACWVLDIVTAATGVGLIYGIPLITGADLLAQYAYLGMGGALYVSTDNLPDAVPTFDNLGSNGHLYFETV